MNYFLSKKDNQEQFQWNQNIPIASHLITSFFIHPKQMEEVKERMFKYITYSAFGKACYKSQYILSTTLQYIFEIQNIVYYSLKVFQV